MAVDDVAPDASGKSDATLNEGGTSDAANDSSGDASNDGTTTESGTDAGPGNYTAFGIIGGLDRLRIVKTVGNTCFEVQLVTPSNNKGNLTLPNNWGFEMAQAIQPAAGCDPKYLGPITNSFMASSQSGTVNFPGPQIPQTVTSLMVTLTFANNPNWCPASELLSATNVPVQ